MLPTITRPAAALALASTLPLVGGCASAGPAGAKASSTARSHPAAAPAATVTGRTAVSADLGSPDGMVLARGSLWVGGYGGSAIEQVDPATGRRMRTIAVGTDPLGVGAAAGSVWAADYGSGQASRIDPRSGTVTATVRVGSKPDSFAMIGGRLWVFDQGSSAATVLSPRSGRVLRTVRLPVRAGWASAGAGLVWVPDLQGSSRTVIGLDPGSGRIRVTVHAAPYPSEVAFGFGSGWVTCKGWVIRFDPRTGAVRARIGRSAAGFDGIAVSHGAVWVADLLGGAVDRIDPATNRITATVAVGVGPRHLIAYRGQLWVSLFDAAELVRLRPAG